MNQIQIASVCRFGSRCAFAAGLLYAFIVCCAFLSPASIATYIASEQYFKDFESYRPVFILLKWMMLLAHGAMIGVVCAYHSLHRDENTGLMNWVSAMALIGFGVGMLQSVQDFSYVPYLADQFAAGDNLIRDTIIVLGVANPSLYILSLGLPGIWFIVVSWRALDNPEIPRYLTVLGFMWGAGNLLTVVAHVFVIVELIYIVAFGALICAPLWSVCEGLFLLKKSRQLKQQ